MNVTKKSSLDSAINLQDKKIIGGLWLYEDNENEGAEEPALLFKTAGGGGGGGGGN